MRILFSGIAATLLLSACASTEPQVASPPAEPLVAGDDETVADSKGVLEFADVPEIPASASNTVPAEPQQVCRYEKSIGSRIGRRGCRTRQQEEMLRQRSQEDLQTTLDRTNSADNELSGN